MSENITYVYSFSLFLNLDTNLEAVKPCSQRLRARKEFLTGRKLLQEENSVSTAGAFRTVIFALHSPKKRSPVLTSSGACLKIRINQVGDAPQLAYQCYFQNFPAKFYRLLKLWLGYAVHIKIIMCTTGVCTHTHTLSPSLSLSSSLCDIYIYTHMINAFYNVSNYIFAYLTLYPSKKTMHGNNAKSNHIRFVS